MPATLTNPFASRRVSLHEHVAAGGRVDRQNGVIRGVKIIGRFSRNGREYTTAALREAVGKYEGVPVYIDHPEPRQSGTGRNLRDKFGWLQNVHLAASGLYGDLHFVRSHPEAEFILEMAERNPRMVGLSHNAEGAIRKRNGKNVVEEIGVVRSVDLVTNPATNASLFEDHSVLPGRDDHIDDATLPPLADDGDDDGFGSSLEQRVTRLEAAVFGDGETPTPESFAEPRPSAGRVSAFVESLREPDGCRFYRPLAHWPERRESAAVATASYPASPTAFIEACR